MSRTGIRRRIRRWLQGPGRFYFSLVFTVLVVAYVAVPWIVQLIDTIGGYNPAFYEPKDLQREAHLESLAQTAEGFFEWETALKFLLLVLVGLLWLISVPSAPWGRRTSRR